jgi:WD40 repeat protein
VVATGSHDSTIRLWDLAGDRPKEVAILRGHQDEVSSLAFSPDGKTLASGSRDETVRLWDLTGAKPRQSAVLRGPKSNVVAVAFGPDGTMLAAGFDSSAEGKAATWVWNLKEEKPKETLRLIDKADNDYVWSMVFSADGKTLATAGVNRTVFWDLQHPKTTSARLEEVWGKLALSRDGKTLAAEGNRSIELVDLGHGKPRIKAKIEWPQQEDALNSLAFSPDGGKLAAADHHGKIGIWEASTSKKLHEWTLPGPVQGIAFAPDGRHLATANANGTAYILRLSQ